MRYNTSKDPAQGRWIEVYEPPLNTLLIEMGASAFEGYSVQLMGGPGAYRLEAMHLGLGIPVTIGVTAMAEGIARYIGKCLDNPRKIGLDQRGSTFARVLYAVTEHYPDMSKYVKPEDYPVLLDAAYTVAVERLAQKETLA